MKRAVHFTAWCLLFIATAAPAATRLDNLVVKPEAAERQVQIEVTIDRGRFDKQACEVLVTPGDDSPPTRLTIAISDASTPRIRRQACCIDAVR